MGVRGAKMNIETMRKELIKIRTYKDGSYYLGGHASAHAQFILVEDDWGRRDEAWEVSVERASPKAIRLAHEYLSSYIEHMRANPMPICPYCGK